MKNLLIAITMTSVLQNWDLFLPQMILGGILGALLSVLGILLVLRNMTFFGITLSQAVGFSVAFCLFMDWDREIYPILLSCLLIIPIILMRRISHIKEDVILGILFVFFASISQVLLALGGNVQNHLMASYFGDILTSQVKLNSFGIWTAGIAFFIYLAYFRRFLFLSFDRDEYRIQIGNPFFFDILFYLILASAVTVAVNVLGSFYSIAHLLIPVFTLLPFVRSTKILALVSVLFSITGTIAGFFLSLAGFSHLGETIYFPTSSMIIVFMCVFSFLILAVRSLFKRLF